MENLINDKIKELSESGKLDEIVTKRVVEFVDGIIKDSLSSLGEANKSFKEKLNAKIIEGFEKLDFVQYSKTLIDLVEYELNKSVVEIGAAPAREMIKKFVGALEKKEWKLSEIIEKYKEAVISGSFEESGEIGFLYEVSDYGTEFVSFDETNEKKKHRYQYKYKLMIDEKTMKIYSLTVEGKVLHPVTEIGLSGFDLFLFKLYAIGCTVECDIKNVETAWSTYN